MTFFGAAAPFALLFSSVLFLFPLDDLFDVGVPRADVVVPASFEGLLSTGSSLGGGLLVLRFEGPPVLLAFGARTGELSSSIYSCIT